MKAFSSRSVALALALAAMAPLVAHAGASEQEADAHFKRGVDLYKETDYRAALIEFKRAYELAPSYRVLFNLGNAYYEVQDYANALKTFQRYLSEGGAQIPPPRRKEVERDVEKLKSRVATIAIDAPPGIDVSVDEVAVGTTPLAEPLLVSAGRRKIVGAKAGRPPVTKIVDVAGADSIHLALDIPDAPAPEQAPPAPTAAASAPPPPSATVSASGPPAAPPPSRGSTPIVPWVVTGALTAGAVVTGVIALSASSSLKTKLGSLGETQSDITSARSKTAAFAAATDILGSCAIVMGGISIFLTATSKPKSGDAANRSVITLGAGLGSIRATGTF